MAYARHTENGRIFIATPDLLKLRCVELISDADAAAMIKNPKLALRGLDEKVTPAVVTEAQPDALLAAAAKAKLEELQVIPDVSKMLAQELREFAVTYLAKNLPEGMGIKAMRNFVMGSLMESGKVALAGADKTPAKSDEASK